MLDKYVGKKVRILKHFDGIVDDFTHILQVYATKDSIGVVLSYEEYRAHADNLHERELEKRSLRDSVLRSVIQDTHVRHLEWVKSTMRAGTHCPVRVEKFVPLPENDYAQLKKEFRIVDILCEVGAEILLPTNTFEFVEPMI